MNVNDKEIFLAIRKHPEQGFRKLMAAYMQPVYWHIRRMVSVHADADDATADKFVSTYCDCVKEFWALGPRVKQNRKSGNTDAQAQQAITDRFERSQKILALREKYYKQYSRFLTQKQIARVYELERGMMKRLGQKKGRQCGRRQGRLGANHTGTGQCNTK